MKNILSLDKKLEDILEGKVVVVTGAGSGLGKAIALGLSYAGAKIGVLDLDKKSVEETVSKINSSGGKAFPMQADVTNPAELELVYSELVKKAGSIYGLVNCAGIARLGKIHSLSPKDIKLANDVNLNGYFLNAHFASIEMIKQKKGCILNISSASARGASEDSSLYGVAKEAQCMMARSWAMDLGKENIRVNALLCGDLYGDEKAGIESHIWNQAYFEKKAVDKKLVSADDKRLGGKRLNDEIKSLVIEYYAKRTALGKQLIYSDVLGIIIMLFSNFGSKITGESIAITSGNPTSFSR